MKKDKWVGKKRTLTDEQIVDGVKAGGMQRERSVMYLHEQYKAYMYDRLPRRFKMSIEDVKDAYSDSLLKLTDQIVAGKFRGESKISTYFYRIFFNTCIDKYRSNASESRKAEWVSEIPEISDRSKDIIRELCVKEEVEELKGYLNQIGDRCKNILWYSSYWGYTHREIAEMMGFKNAQSVTTQRYACIIRLQKCIMSNRNRNNHGTANT
jgi:RNA polymerase sigma factor (sigma-70 family)